MLHLHLPCERLDLSEAMEGWEKDLSTACERRDDLSVYICLVPQPRWGIDVVLQSWSEKEMEKGDGRRWTREKSQAARREVGIFCLFYLIFVALNDVFESRSQIIWDAAVHHGRPRHRLWPDTRRIMDVHDPLNSSSSTADRSMREFNLYVCVCLHLEFKAKVTNLLLLKASCCTVFYLHRMPANRCLTSSLNNTLFVS